MGAKNGTTFTPGARIMGQLDNPATTGLLQFDTRTAGALTTKMTITSAGAVNMSSGATCTVAGVWTDASDARLKTNVKDASYGLSEIMKLRSVSYDLIKTGTHDIGFIAQELQKIVPEVVSGKEGDLAKGETLGVAYSHLVPVLVNAMKEQQAMIEAQQKQIDELKALIKK